MPDNWDEVSYVISSSYRVTVLQRLADSPATPSRIATDTDRAITHVSRALQGLREHDLVELLVSEERQKGRVYGITEHGETIWETIEAQNLA
jgi:DNA-binding MarR family transcriptional regulator